MYFLNSGNGYSLFKEEASYKTYVDKTLMINTVYRYAREMKKYICVTRPRRFGKTVAANMIAGFFDKSTAENSRLIFEGMEIGKLRDKQDVEQKEWLEKPDKKPWEPAPALCWQQQGKQNVIRINMIEVLDDKTKSYMDFQNALDRKLRKDLHSAFPSLPVDATENTLADLMDMTGEEFVFVIDEWDAIFEKRFMTSENKEDYLEFLKNMLKDRAYVHFAYMTGIMPIAKHSSGSPLNMFIEFSSINDSVFYPYFGLTKKEISTLMKRMGIKKPKLKDLEAWYDGYVRKDGIHVYNPASVAKALGDGVCMNNWSGTGRMNEIKLLLQNNAEGLRDDILRMVAGESLEIRLGGFSVEDNEFSTRDEILSAMVVYGFLSYDGKNLSIPNHELMVKFKEALSSKPMGLKQTLENSMALFKATLNQDEDKIARLVEQVHDENIPLIQYNDENSLACVVTLGYLAAMDEYEVSREDKAGKGYADFIFTPRINGRIPIILELKYNHSAKNALKCIHERGYITRFRRHKRVLLVGINYSEATKKHTCLTEMVEQ